MSIFFTKPINTMKPIVKSYRLVTIIPRKLAFKSMQITGAIITAAKVNTGFNRIKKGYANPIKI